MMVQRNRTMANLDWISILLWLVIMVFGWMNIYSANIMEADGSMFDLSQRFGKQLIWIGASLVLAMLLLALDAKFYIYFSYFLYVILLGVLLGVLIFGREINGAKSWFVIGGFQLQPSEFAKPITALALANLLSSHNYNLKRFWHLVKAGAIIMVPPMLIILQPDLGSVLVYSAFILVLFREGFSASIMMMLAALALLFFTTLLLDKALILLLLVVASLIIYMVASRSFKKGVGNAVWIAGIFGLFYGINYLLQTEFSLFMLGLASLLPVSMVVVVKGFRLREYVRMKILAGLIISIVFIISVDFAMNNVLKPHQQHRIYVTLGLEDDPQGVGYNVNQSKIAIGSGGFSGKGYLNGTQTKLHFVPEQSTDFIFCTVGEEWGFLGTTFVILLYAGLFLRLIKLAERQRSSFSRIFGYGFISILLIHFIVNIGMTIGLLPVIGIPLPFFSYGGSSLWAFTMFLFIFLRLDASRLELLR
ncbi:MAG: rod shape-determining protein RodA [Bacteroidia bacterium]|nr:MAG: rod shape-determining protein RodA [Bacteroidia bacterium]